MNVLRQLRGRLDPEILSSPPDNLTAYECAPNTMRGRALAVVRPRSVAELRAVLGVAREGGVRLVPQGANSGLVGGGLPDNSGSQVVLSLERLRDRFILDEDDRTLTVSAGWTLDEINEKIEHHGLRLPIEVGSSPSVGGMVASNIAGSNVLRNGDARRQVLGVEAVIPDAEATLINALSPLRKRNERLDVTQLFVGTEGRFGIVTAATFELADVPRSRSTAWLSLPGPTALMPVLRHFERCVGEWLSAFELASDSAVRLLEPDHPELVQRLPPGTEDKILVEIGAANDQAEELMLSVLELLDDRDLMADSVVGAPAGLWQVRHTIPLITEQMDPVASFDIAVPRSRLHAARNLLALRVRDIEPEVVPIELGHVGDGGLHFILPIREATASDSAAMAGLRQVVFDTVVREFGGTFSAEHGVGRKNLDAYERYVPHQVRALEDVLKRSMDPNHVLD